MERQFTATVYILHKGKVLLLFHKKYQKWLPPGGHVEPNEAPHEAAKREALEETGIEIEFITQENILIQEIYTHSIPRPYLMLVESIPAYGANAAHEHIDSIYVAKIKTLSRAQDPHEMHWFTLDEVLKLQTGIEVFADVQKTIEHLFSHTLVQTSASL